MLTEITHQAKRYRVNLHHPMDISLPVGTGNANPSCYWADPVKFETITSGNFIGSVRQGGSVNYQKLFITPHGNGTHTECYGHISADEATINQCLTRFHFIAELISIEPTSSSTGDRVLTLESVQKKITAKHSEALIIRTLPNHASKKNRQYSGTNPPYLEADAVAYLVSQGVEHLLVDLPSLDKEVDGGKLAAHKAFWKFPDAIRKNCSVTELIFVDDSIADGLYLLNLQIASLEMDASPSKPVLYKLEEVL
jgi:arylformamidase